MLPSTFLVLDFLVLLLLYAIYRAVRPQCSSVPLPPGPKASWLGSLSLPSATEYPWRVYSKWRETYGDVIYIHVFGNPLIILNTRKAARDLFENQSSIYSSRPCRTMVNELMGWDWIFSSMPYGDTWRKHRRLFHNHFNPAASLTYLDVQTKEAHSLLQSLAENPADFVRHIRRESAAIVMNISYGYQISPEDDYYVSLADKALATLGNAGLLGTYLVDYIPALKHLPSWLPGVQFKKKAMEWSKLSRAMIDEPFRLTQRLMSDGKARPSLATTELEVLAYGKDTYFDETIVKNVSAISYAAGAETTVSVILSFFLAMSLYPDIQRRGQAEVDNVTGGTRLPTYEDRDKMPYVNGLVYECLRWNPVVPLGLAHKSTKEDIYNGMRIPKGTTLFANVWGILHDEALYPDPMTFRPERFLEKSEPGTNEYPVEAFGFGRRICPGRYLAEATVWITIATVLATFDITKAVDENGQVIEPSTEYTSSFLSRPKPFKCNIKPRTEAALKLIRDSNP